MIHDLYGKSLLLSGAHVSVWCVVKDKVKTGTLF